MMKKMILAAAAASVLAGPALAQPPSHAPAHGYRAKQAYAAGYRDGARYDNRYYADRAYYGSQGSRAYNDGYCRKDSNAEGTIIGAVGGGVLGNVLGKRGDKTLTTVVGAGLGGLIGREVDRSERRCR